MGAIGDLDAYQLPDAKGAQSLARWLTDDTDAARALSCGKSSAPRRVTKGFADVLATAAREGRLRAGRAQNPGAAAATAGPCRN